MILVSCDIRVLAGVAVFVGWNAASASAQVFERIGTRALLWPGVCGGGG